MAVWARSCAHCSTAQHPLNYRKCIIIIEELEVTDPAINADTARWATAGWTLVCR
jgi:hypothetical protein